MFDLLFVPAPTEYKTNNKLINVKCKNIFEKSGIYKRKCRIAKCNTSHRQNIKEQILRTYELLHTSKYNLIPRYTKTQKLKKLNNSVIDIQITNLSDNIFSPLLHLFPLAKKKQITSISLNR